ncbi:hypothetical protein C8R44DRAFT_761372 [Mycena epipterygia]|nr:hypothetical protein C8R44DRAFT_761372 [Mycena epipterygia]
MDQPFLDPAAAHEEAIVALQNILTTKYVSAISEGPQILLYDHVLTLDDEVAYVWSAPSTIAKILFLILRYMVPVFMIIQTVTRSGLPVIPFSDLVPWTSFTTYAGWLSIVISNFLVLLRIWTTLPRGHRLIRWSVIFFIVVQLTSLIVTTWVVTNMIPVLVFSPLVGICTFSSKPDVVWLWVVGVRLFSTP